MVNNSIVFVQVPNLLLANPKMYYNLGLLYVAAAARSCNYKVSLFDNRDGSMEYELPYAPVVAFSCTTPEIVKAKEISRFLRDKYGLYTIVGGAHPTLMPDDCRDAFDCVVVGEGEEVIPHVLRERPQGVVKAQRIRNINSLSLPLWSLYNDPFSETLMPGERYGKGEKAATVMTSRGCPYRCSFCGLVFRTPVVYRSVQSVEAELQSLISQGVRSFRFEDDNFTINPNLKAMLILYKSLYIKYKCACRSNAINPMIARLLAESGCTEVCLGVESADNDVLVLNQKGVTPEEHERAVKIIKDAGMLCKTYFMAGLPGETEKSIELNMSFFQRTKPDKWTLSTFTPYPGCEVFNNPSKYGVEIVDKNWNNWWNFVDHFVYRLKDASQDVLWERYQRLYKFFKDNS